MEVLRCGFLDFLQWQVERLFGLYTTQQIRANCPPRPRPLILLGYAPSVTVRHLEGAGAGFASRYTPELVYAAAIDPSVPVWRSRFPRHC